MGVWRYSINYGPEGEANYANVYDDQGALVSNLKTQHAVAVVAAMNAALAQRTALEQCQKALAMMIAPDAIRQTTTINAFEQCTAAELAARKALGKDAA